VTTDDPDLTSLRVTVLPSNYLNAQYVCISGLLRLIPDSDYRGEPGGAKHGIV
jgi:hypothetical protein